MLGRQVQTKEADVDHEIGEETGARKSHISQYEKYEFWEETGARKSHISQYEIGEETSARKSHISQYEK